MLTAVKPISRQENELNHWADHFETRSVEALLEWAVEHYAPQLVMTSNFGAEGVVLLDHLARVAPGTPVIYLSTGYQFAATDEVKERLQARYPLNLIEASAALSVAEQDAQAAQRVAHRRLGDAQPGGRLTDGAKRRQRDQGVDRFEHIPSNTRSCDFHSHFF